MYDPEAEFFENTRPDPHTPSMQRTDDVTGLTDGEHITGVC